MRNTSTLTRLSNRLAGAAFALAIPLVVLSGCGDDVTPPPEATPSGGTPSTDGSGTDSGPGGRPLGQAEPGPGVHFRLSDAEPAAAAGAGEDGPRSTQGEPIDGAALNALVARLPDMPAGAADTADYRMPPGPPRPAIAGEAIEVSFPPPVDAGPPPASDSSPLVVERYQPEGDVPLASHIAVTFSRPFAPLAANTALDAMDVPVEFDPQPVGRWRWVGTQTLLFEPTLRFPMATEYTVNVPAGVTAADGTTLSEGTSWTFRTPPPSVTSFWNTVSSPDRQALVVLGFDQAIDPASVLPFVNVRDGRTDVELRLASDAELADYEFATNFVSRLEDGRWMALVTAPMLTAGANVKVQVDAGLRSEEGPRTSDEQQDYAFDVYDLLKATTLHCDSPDRGQHDGRISGGRGRLSDCDPFSEWAIEFNNQLDGDSLTEGLLTVEPEVPGLRVEVHSSALGLRGVFKGRTRYTVRLAPGLMDDFDQSLEEALELTFETGDAPSALVVPGNETLILDPAGPRALSVTTMNNKKLDVTLYRATPEQWPLYIVWRNSFNRWTNDARLKGEPMPLLFDREPDHVTTMDVDADADTFGRVLIDLQPALDGDLGHVIAIVSPNERGSSDYDRWRNRPHARWVQSTNLGLDVMRDATSTVEFVTDLRDGSPIKGARVSASIAPTDAETTGADGLSRTGQLGGDDSRDGYFLAEMGADSMLLPHHFWRMRSSSESTRWFVFDDRGIYRPGETLAVKGYLRRFGSGVGGDIEALSTGDEASDDEPDDAPAARLPWILRGWDGNEIATGEDEIGSFGAFSLVLDLPADAPVGRASLELSATGKGIDRGTGTVIEINIAEFRRPEFEVTAAAEVPEVIVGESGSVSVEASYFAGGSLPGAEVRWWVRAEPSEWRPAGWDDFVFGQWRPWWRYWDTPVDSDSAGEELISRTDDEGRHRLAIDLSNITPPHTMSLQAQATVSDVNRQASTASAALIAHPAELYVGLRATERVIERGSSARVEFIVTDLEGAAVSERIVEIVAQRLTHQRIGGEWQEVGETVDTCEGVSAGEPETCSLRLSEGGQFRIRATVSDDAGRSNESEITVWVPGGGPIAPRDAKVSEETVELIPDKDDYAVGDTAQILIRAPFAPAEALVSLRRSGIVETQRLRLEDGSGTLELPIEEAYIPNLMVDVQVVGSAARGSGASELDVAGGSDGSVGSIAPRPAFARGTLEVRVPPLIHTLDASPGPCRIGVAARRRDDCGHGRSRMPPVCRWPDAEIALVVVDEAVLALTNYRIPDPIEAFYTQRGSDVVDERNRHFVHLASLADLMSGADGGEGMFFDEAVSEEAEMGDDSGGMAGPGRNDDA